MSGTLYVLGTPIGNLGDFSPRALETLEAVDFIAAEDTRVTAKLLNHFNIKKPMISYHEHNKLQKAEIIISRIQGGESCALVTDAGMPAISDPGEDLVRQCHEQNVPVACIPGPSAVISALALSGMPSGRFTFEGFLSMNKNKRREHLEELVDERRTMIFYEAPHKLYSTLCDMKTYFGGERKIALVKEITKIYEQVIRTTLDDAVVKFEDGAKGEFVIIVEGAPEKQEEITLDYAVKLAEELMENGLSVADASKAAAKQTGFKKSDIYKQLI
ncbi:MAG: 16S rRNA (cytidine(1402)-2'-O)-methyltransferase [Clostridia bacterium]|nr:16S rRNA (cytidine(1402)-2'-O)-methyltransferase [Clostridia bacterium]